MKIFKKSKSFNKENPITLKITNDTDKDLNWVIFGLNKFSNEDNFGNHPSIQIENLTTDNSTYFELLEEISNLDIETFAMRFVSNNKLNIHQTILHKEIDKHNNHIERPINLSLFMDYDVLKNTNEVQTNLFDFSFQTSFKISSQKHLSGIIKNKSYIIITLFT